MKFVVSILLTALLGFVSGLYLPWWGIAPAALLVSLLLPQKALRAFLSGFIAIFLLWGSMAWLIDASNGSILSQRIAQILGLGSSTALLIIVTAFVGALVGGMASLCGSFFNRPS